jgi:hypothetical protein
MNVRHHDGRIADLDLGMADLAARAGHSHQFRGSESLLVEVDGLCGAINDQVRGYGVISLRDWLDFIWHDYSPLL